MIGGGRSGALIPDVSFNTKALPVLPPDVILRPCLTRFDRQKRADFPGDMQFQVSRGRFLLSFHCFRSPNLSRPDTE